MATMQEETMTTSSDPTSALPAVADHRLNDDSPIPALAADDLQHSSESSSGSGSEEDQPTNARLQRPKMGSRKSSGTIIVPRESAYIELEEEEYDENDARTMSPRRTSEEIEQMGKDARHALMEQAKQLQQSLLEVVERVETVKNEHEKLEGGNRFLQSYIGGLMNTSKITSTGPGKGKKGKGRAAK